MTRISMVNVPYSGAPPALTDLLAGQVQVIFDTLSSSIEHIRAGKLRALGVTTATRSEALPDVPTVSDFVPGYEAVAWTGIGGPRNTPAEVIDMLNRRSTRASPIRRSRHGLPTWATFRFPDRLPTSAGLSL